MPFAFRTLLSLALIGAAALPCLAGEAGKPVNFSREVLPILSNKCFVCHGPDGEARDVLRLDSYEAATSGNDGRKAIDPDHPDESGILLRIHSADNPMPPEGAEKPLTPHDRDVLTRWIRQGGKYAKHWAFVPPTVDLPAPSLSKEETIDAYIAARFPDRVTFAPQADKAVLARRAALVLTGLPVEPSRLAEFLADESPGAYQKLVDDLLANPRFGEHQARYWLDAVRYGDTHGLHLDNRRGIYPYRDWVVRAFNDNLPLDQFLTWQLAGDLLGEPTLEQLVATGFVRMNPTTAEGGAIPAEFQAKNNFDRVETLGTVLLGMTLTCARCHSHKYDPISQTEYYRLLAFFNSTAEHSMDGNAYEYAPVIKAPASQAAWRQWDQLRAERSALLQEAGVEPAGAAADERKLSELAKSGKFQQRAAELVKRIDEAKQQFTTTLVAGELDKPRATKVLHRGEYHQPVGEPLSPGVIAVMGEFPEDVPHNRLGLAKWLTSGDHPLVGRVLVNQIWLRTFGRGLVRTPEDFGLQGQQPTHPELLDWLAVELHESGWDLKHMLRLMVLSKSFRQSSAWRDDVKDPENRLFARGPRHRLDAEVIRDMGLWASGLLEDEMGGEGVKPYQPDGMWKALAHPASNTKQYVRDEGRRLYRRSLYVYWKRTSPHPMMTLFDAPSREASCVRRSRTNTPLQSLALFNETQRVEMSRTLAQRLLNEAEGDAARLDMLFTLVACRKPTSVEREACQSLLEKMRQRYESSPEDADSLLNIADAPRDDSLDPAEHAAWTQVASTVLASDIAIMLY